VCLPTDEMIKKCDIFNYIAIKKNEIMSFLGKWMELEIMMLSKIYPIQKDKYHVFPHMWILHLRIQTNNKQTNKQGYELK
jgi:hypothetical protein